MINLPKPLIAYFLGFLFAGLAVALRAASVPLLGSTGPYLFLYPVLIFVFIRFGLGPGIAAGSAGIIATEFWLILPGGYQSLLASVELRGIIVFCSAMAVGYFARRLYQEKQTALLQAADIKQSRALVQALMEGTTDPIFIKDLDSRFMLANPATLALIDKSPSQAIGRPFEEIYPDPEIRHALLEHDRRVMESGHAEVFEEHIPTRDGPRIFLATKTPLRDETGRVTGLIAISRDITERKHWEESLRRSEEKYRFLFETMRQGVIYQNAAGKIISANPAAETILGRTSRELLGGDFFEEKSNAIQEDGSSFPASEHPAAIALRTGREVADTIIGIFNPRMRMRRWIRINAAPVFLAGASAPFQVYTIFDDITDRRRAAQALEEKEKLLRLFVKHTPAAVAMFDRAMRYLAYSDRWLSDYGLGRKSLAGRSHYTVFPEIGEELKRFHRQALQGASLRKEEDLFLRADGRAQWLRWEIHPWRTGEGRIGGIVIFTEDITAGKQTELALRNSEERYRRLVELSPDGILINRNNRIVFLNPAALRLFNAPDPAHILGKSPFDLVEPDFHTRMSERMRLAAQGRPAPPAEEKIHQCDGQIREVETSASPFIDQEGPGIQVILRDITERKQAQAAMGRYQLISRYARDPLLLIDLDGRIVDGNRAAEDFYGYTREELLQLRIFTLRRIDDPETVRCQMREAEDRGILFEATHLRKDGTTVPVEVSSQGVTVDGQRMLLSVIRDITKRKQIEAKLQEADRRKDEFLAMLAHELRNPLAPIRNAVYLMRAHQTADPDTRRQRDMIDRQVNHMSHLLDDLLDVSRITRGTIALRRERVALAEVLTRAVEIAGPRISERRHRLQLTPPPADLLLEGDPDRLVQIVSNLLTNAAKYTEENGRIWLEASREGAEAVIRVRDTGIGIVPSMLDSIFDLFIQAERGLDRSQGGLGIGLTIVRNLVRMHGGTITANSPGLGHGSEFTVRLPAAQPSAS